MNDTKLRSTDLNLLVTLAALLETHNVSRAAESLGLSQPAVSHALNRLRETFGDALLVRSGRQMVPTPRAEMLKPIVRAVIADIEQILAPIENFIPQETTRTFVIATNGFSSQLLIPELVLLLRMYAPQANLKVVQTGYRDLQELLSDGKVDLCLISGRMDHLPETLMMRSLFDNEFVCTMREGHPFASGVQLREFADADHILVSPRGDDHGVIDAELAQRGLRRRVAVVLSDFMAVPELLRASDLVITTPVSISRLFGQHCGLINVDPPEELDLGSGSLMALWHERVQNDPVNRWLRRVVMEAGERVEQGELAQTLFRGDAQG